MIPSDITLEDWRVLAKDLLWRNYIYFKNEPSGYYKVDVDGYENRHCPKNSVIRGLAYQSWIHPSCYHELTWEELCDEFGIITEYLK